MPTSRRQATRDECDGRGLPAGFGTEVTSAVFDDSAARWTGGTAGGETFGFGVLISAAGQLTRPVRPDIAGKSREGGGGGPGPGGVWIWFSWAPV
ncbi:hypothetical protein [Actinocrispum sp. NPDC049592]|uniref:hypothetical protein n=1 Tax=Actinocrispum sp. NPDC049592 TaxID=3154835 RepID=UPI0034443A02